MRISRDIIAIGVLGNDPRTIRRLVSELPVDFPASVLIVFQSPAAVLDIEQILTRKAALPFIFAREGQKLRRGYVYLGSPYSSMVTRSWGVIGLEPAAANDIHHLAINRFFKSAASVWGNRVIGVLLNSNRYFQNDSLNVVKLNGGIAVIENQEKIFIPSASANTLADESHRLTPSPDVVNLLARLIEMPTAMPLGKALPKVRGRVVCDC